MIENHTLSDYCFILSCEDAKKLSPETVTELGLSKFVKVIKCEDIHRLGEVNEN